MSFYESAPLLTEVYSLSSALPFLLISVGYFKLARKKNGGKRKNGNSKENRDSKRFRGNNEHGLVKRNPHRGQRN